MSVGDYTNAPKLADLLAQASSAHARYEGEELGGRRDAEWPRWYASYLREHGLSTLLDGLPGRDRIVSNLENVLAEADGSYNQSPKSEDWPPYYAKYILALASGEEGVMYTGER